MEENSRVTKHFFKVMSCDFHSNLALPKAFCRNLNEVKLANITSSKGIWKINVSRSNSGTVFFEEGWGDFVRQHDLAVGDIVVFEHIGEMHFNAFVFDFTACEKKFDDDLAERNEGSAGVCNNLEAIKTNVGSSCLPRDPYFVITMKHHNSLDCKQPYMRIPVEFWRSNGLNEKTSINLRDPSSKNWLVELKFYKNVGNGRVTMERGWKQFYESNKLKNGDVCTFELNHNPKGSTVASMAVHIFPAPTQLIPHIEC